MSKKKFSQGLDDLFRDNAPEQVNPGAPKTTGSKRFAAGLEALLQETLDEAFGGPQASAETQKQTPEKQYTGLDALLRQTVDIREVLEDENTGKKRLTVSVDKSRLEQLKLIARLENAYLKDLLVAVIDDYIQEYVNKKGMKL